MNLAIQITISELMIQIENLHQGSFCNKEFRTNLDRKNLNKPKTVFQNIKC